MYKRQPVKNPVESFKPPAIFVSTPAEESVEDGFEILTTIEVTVYAVSEDAVDEMLGRVEKAFAADETLAGTVRSLQFQSYELDETNDGLFVGTQRWTAIAT